VRVLFREECLTVIRRQLNRDAPARLEMEDVFNAVRDALSKEALLAAGDISIKKKRKKRKRVPKAESAADQPATHDDANDGACVETDTAPQSVAT